MAAWRKRDVYSVNNGIVANSGQAGGSIGVCWYCAVAAAYQRATRVAASSSSIGYRNNQYYAAAA